MAGRWLAGLWTGVVVLGALLIVPSIQLLSTGMQPKAPAICGTDADAGAGAGADAAALYAGTGACGIK